MSQPTAYGETNCHAREISSGVANKPLHVTGAAIPVPRGMKATQAAPAAERGRSVPSDVHCHHVNGAATALSLCHSCYRPWSRSSSAQLLRTETPKHFRRRL